jgi:hypothetical protein
MSKNFIRASFLAAFPFGQLVWINQTLGIIGLIVQMFGVGWMLFSYRNMEKT